VRLAHQQEGEFMQVNAAPQIGQLRPIGMPDGVLSSLIVIAVRV
jgi:hypothetical protein